MEADSVKREVFQATLSTLSADQLVFLDESGIDLGICKTYGWGKKGDLITGKKSGKHYQRLNIIAAQQGKQLLAPVYFTEKCNTAVFNQWVKEHLIKTLKPGQVVIMDNASFHKSEKTKEMIASVGARVLFLPPYSPDLNPIENTWGTIKNNLRNKIATSSRRMEEFLITLCELHPFVSIAPNSD